MKKDDSFGAEGCFAEKVGSSEMKKKSRTFHMRHDEEMNFNCKKCNAKTNHKRDYWINYFTKQI